MIATYKSLIKSTLRKKSTIQVATMNGAVKAEISRVQEGAAGIPQVRGTGFSQEAAVLQESLYGRDVTCSL